MKLGTGKILEIRQSSDGSHHALVRLEGVSIPQPGQYLQAFHPEDQSQAAGFSLYPGGLTSNDSTSNTLTTAGPIPPHWAPGGILNLRRPLGNGFKIPQDSARLVIATFSRQVDHLLPLTVNFLNRGGEIALFTNTEPASLPSKLPVRIEVNKLEHLADGLGWGDFAAFSVSLDEVTAAMEHINQLSLTGIRTQLLVFGQFPCAGLAECGICALRVPQGRTILACKDGPVLEI